MGGTVIRFVAFYVEEGVIVFNKFCNPEVLSSPQFCEITGFEIYSVN